MPSSPPARPCNTVFRVAVLSFGSPPGLNRRKTANQNGTSATWRIATNRSDWTRMHHERAMTLMSVSTNDGYALGRSAWAERLSAGLITKGIEVYGEPPPSERARSLALKLELVSRSHEACDRTSGRGRPLCIDGIRSKCFAEINEPVAIYGAIRKSGRLVALSRPKDNERHHRNVHVVRLSS